MAGAARSEPAGLAARLLELGEELRREGVAIGTSELLDAFAVLGEIDWREQRDFREALAATLAKCRRTGASSTSSSSASSSAPSRRAAVEEGVPKDSRSRAAASTPKS